MKPFPFLENSHSITHKIFNLTYPTVILAQDPGPESLSISDYLENGRIGVAVVSPVQQ